VNYVEVIRRRLATEVIYQSRGRWDIAETPTLLDSYALLVLTVGVNVTREHVHDAWSLWSNSIGPEHRYLVPFAELPADIQARDELGRVAIVAVARSVWEAAL
jgi:hypothetical protein